MGIQWVVKERVEPSGRADDSATATSGLLPSGGDAALVGEVRLDSIGSIGEFGALQQGDDLRISSSSVEVPVELLQRGCDVSADSLAAGQPGKDGKGDE